MDGWEPAESAVARFSSMLLVARRRDIRATVVVTHGIVLALWLAPRLGATPLQVWRRLGTPDLWWYDPNADAVSRVPLRQRVALATPSRAVV